MIRTRGSVRIIGGRWRGTRIAVADSAGLRPTSDRVRETLFNWLAPDLPGTRCLDLFAGTGALGFEAVSRGAARADLVESDGRLAAALDELKLRLKTEDVNVYRADGLSYLVRDPHSYDLVFLDPPFGAGLLGEALRRLKRGWINERSRVYVEHSIEEPQSFEDWRVVRFGKTRQVNYALLERPG